MKIKYSKYCPSCHSLIKYKKKATLIDSLKKNRICRSCYVKKKEEKNILNFVPHVIKLWNTQEKTH